MYPIVQASISPAALRRCHWNYLVLPRGVSDWCTVYNISVAVAHSWFSKTFLAIVQLHCGSSPSAEEEWNEEGRKLEFLILVNESVISNIFLTPVRSLIHIYNSWSHTLCVDMSVFLIPTACVFLDVSSESCETRCDVSGVCIERDVWGSFMSEHTVAFYPSCCWLVFSCVNILYSVLVRWLRGERYLLHKPGNISKAT